MISVRQPITRRRLTTVAVLATAAVLALPALPAAAVPLPPAVTAGALPTPQTNGIVYSVAIAGNTVYAGGSFTRARPYGVAPGGPGEVTRQNLLAFDLRTGALLPWAPAAANSTVLSTDPGPFCRSVGTNRWTCDSVFRIEASPAGDRVYVAGDFDKIGTQWRSRVAAFDTATGALVSSFRPQVAGRVRGLSVTADTVYLGGGFSSVNGTARSRLAAVDTAGALRPWAPTANAEVWAVLAAPALNRVIVGGAFGLINGASRRAMMAVNATTGASVAWQARVPGGREVVTDVVTDGSGTAYISAYDYGSGPVRFEGRLAVDIVTGQPRWWDGCYGDTMNLAVSGGVLYSVGHAHDCAASNAIPERGADFRFFRLLAHSTDVRGMASVNHNHVRIGDPIPELLPWFPNTNSGPPDSVFKHGTWTVDANSEYVVVGGEFTAVNTHSSDSQPQQSLTRFAARGVPGAVHNGPQAPFPAPVLTREPGTGAVAIRWRTTWNAQNSEMTYQVMRVGTANPIHEVTSPSRPWDRPELRFVDRQVTAGTYWIRAVDADGQRRGSPQASITNLDR